MLARVRAVPFDEYQAWYDRQAADIAAARKAAAAERKRIQDEETRAAEQSESE